MLDARTIATIKATAPAIAQLGPKLTAHFYGRMLENHPELKNVFNASNQRSGAQSGALFNAVLAYAQNIDNLSALGPAVELIAHKHASLLIRPDQYPIVGKYLLEAIDELLHPGAEVLGAWERAYGVLADVFISREAEIYQASAQADGGWRGVREFRIKQKQPQSAYITSFTLEPVDGKPLPRYEPGQYLSVFLKPEGFAYRQIRQYSLTQSFTHQSHYRIAVKREDQGVVSQWLHQQAQEGDVVELAVPHGDFILAVTPQTPVTLISAGVGVTPMLSMLDSLVQQQHLAQVNWFHGATNQAQLAFDNEVQASGAQLAKFSRHLWFSQPGNAALGADISHGQMQLAPLESLLSAPNMAFYLCGPQGFMHNINQQLQHLGIEASRIHYECFGPLQAI